MEKSAQRFLGNSLDYKEGLSAFLEKRKPNFKGN
jgi:enoyl-CoA hydratase/carnithine racemase